jgi:hypothetical protein
MVEAQVRLMTQDAPVAQTLDRLSRARARVHALQRAAVLGFGDSEALDAAVLAYRRAHEAASGWLAPAPPIAPTPAELFAGWLVEASLQRAGPVELVQRAA